MNGYLHIAELLINHKNIDVNVSWDNGQTAIHIACFYRYYDIIKLLINKNVKVNVKTYPDLWTPLHYACFNQDLKIIKLLLNIKNIDINIRDYNGKTAYQIGIQDNNKDSAIIKLFENFIYKQLDMDLVDTRQLPST